MKRRGRSQPSMDMFVVRGPKASPPVSPTKATGVLRQATLEDLKGVVVVEEMERAKVVLERSDVPRELKVDTLQRLLCKTPAKEVLMRTKLGKTVHKLCRAKEADVAAVARQVYASWKKHILSKENRPYIEVKCDLKTQKLRDSARRMLTEVLRKENEEGEGDDDKSRGGKDEVDDYKSNRNSHAHLESKETKQDLHKLKQKQKEDGEGKESTTSKTPRKESGTKNNTHEGKQKQEEKSDGKNNRNTSHKRAREESGTKNNIHEGKQKQEDKSEGNTAHKRAREDSDTEEYVRNTKLKQEKEREGKSERTKNHKEESPDGDTQQASVEMLAEHLEHRVYHGSQRLVDLGYRRTIRSLVFALKHQGDIRKAVVSATLSVQDFVKQHMKS